MNILKTVTVAVAIGGFAASASAQDLELPAPSPLARVMQQVGVSQMEVEYSSPGVKGRDIFGGLVPYGEMWRTGANAPTKVTFSHDVEVGGKDVKAGTYALLTIPKKDGWAVILHKDPQARPRNYDKKGEAARITVKPETMPEARERLTFVFAKTTPAGTSLNLEWNKTRVAIPIVVDTTALAKANIERFNAQSSRNHANAARFHLEHKDYDAAIAHIDRALAIDDNWFNNYIKGQVLAAKGDYKGAVPLAEKAWEQGQKAEYFFWKDEVKASLEEWKKK